MKKCNICGDPVLARGFCRKHYLRWYKHGDPNIVPDRKDYIPKGRESPNFKHGKWNHPLYKVWSGMMRRCYNENEEAFKFYGALGIKVCDRWHDINKFIEDMGERPSGSSLDRVDGSKGYSPENCRWANHTTQARNRKSFVKLDTEKAKAIRSEPRRSKNGRGEGMTRLDIAKKYSVSVATVKKVLSGNYWKT